jgi:2-keto-4-pentenoate hydratase/2-oxohepta-3-ene-1,7-dioic acid hydratase in catechol pathway
MEIVAFRHNGESKLGLQMGEEVADITEVGAPSTLDEVLAAGALADLKAFGEKAKTRLALAEISEFLPPVASPSKAIAVGLNYVEHAAEGGAEPPEYPVLFSRYPTSWVGHNQALVQPKVSKAFDYEGEMVIVIGKAGRYVSKDEALNHVAGYSIFNDGSMRDYQMRTQQWTAGKIFDKSGGFGPSFVSADSLPPGATGLQLKTILNGQELQNANTRDMIFDVATLVSLCSDIFTLTPGDIIISGTPEGVGGMRKPPIFMQPGDVCQVSIEGLGVLSNPVVGED